MLGGWLAVAGGPGAVGQDAGNTAAAVADREAAEERYRRLNAAVEDLLAAQATLQRKISALAEELRDLREDQSKATSQAVTREEWRRLAEKVQTIEEKRLEDRKKILDELEKLLKAPAPVPATPPPSSPPPKSQNSDEKFYRHVVEPRQTLSEILQAYREQGVKVTLKDVEEANPGLNPNRLKVGQEVLIPMGK